MVLGTAKEGDHHMTIKDNTFDGGSNWLIAEPPNKVVVMGSDQLEQVWEGTPEQFARALAMFQEAQAVTIDGREAFLSIVFLDDLDAPN